MTWVPWSACNGLLQGQLVSEAVEFFGHNNNWLDVFVEISKCSRLGKGGVARLVLSSPNMLYCSDITQLSLAEYPLVPYARAFEFRGWFTLCVQSSHTANDIYVLEFFLPTSKGYGDNSWTSLSLILGTMEENFETFNLASGQELGDLLSVEVMDFQDSRKLHSVQKIQAKGGGVMLQLRQLDQASTGAIHSGTNVISEDQNYMLSSLEALQNGEVMMQLDSSCQPPLDPPNNGQNVVIAEQNIITVTSSKERKRKTERKHRGTGVRIEVSWEDILECTKNKMSRKGAAEKLQASDSVGHTKPAFQDADIVTIRANYENNTIKFRLSLRSRLVVLQQEVAKRLDLEAGTYCVSQTRFGHMSDMSRTHAGHVQSEVHIEQGPVLESVGLRLGVVKGIAGQTILKVTVRGSQGHAGTVPMSMRQDPMAAAAAELIVLLESFCKHPDDFISYDGHCKGITVESLAGSLVGMLFVCGRRGISHSPTEHVSDDDVWAGGLAILAFLETQL
ncbi:hypothetical protein RHMOL_Rhmol02G0309700 [Rhododendron molle]|uniref:Uncharacterized protein n=1 Tax=Rhododendron molle TaxID=49168 RepID=A0ACC0PZ96_RHOML|nr:hypothetical protein RHMOL_Rhmol02G0309700 [Rhododendron molle]